MKIAIVGFGAILTYLACRLSQTSAELSVVVRRTHFATTQEHGIAMITEKGNTLRTHPHVIDDAESESHHVLKRGKRLSCHGSDISVAAAKAWQLLRGCVNRCTKSLKLIPQSLYKPDLKQDF